MLTECAACRAPITGEAAYCSVCGASLNVEVAQPPGRTIHAEERLKSRVVIMGRIAKHPWTLPVLGLCLVAGVTYLTLIVLDLRDRVKNARNAAVHQEETVVPKVDPVQ